MTEELYSIRMHATRNGRHLCGAERLGGAEVLDELAAALVRRALEHPRGRAERLRLSLDALEPQEVSTAGLPDLTTVPVDDFHAGRCAALRLLLEAGVDGTAAAASMAALVAGAAPDGGSMRGAMLVDAATGRRLEPDQARGVRVSRMDLTPTAERLLRRGLAARGLDNPHVREALVLAGKVLAAPGMVAELCWSDDPDYTAGYVASPRHGYVRFPHLKPRGEERGGRVFFLRCEGLELDELIHYLERHAVLFNAVGRLEGETLSGE